MEQSTRQQDQTKDKNETQNKGAGEEEGRTQTVPQKTINTLEEQAG